MNKNYLTISSKKKYSLYKGYGIFGFTLIELLVVVGIISILFSIGYANFRGYQRKQAVMAAGRQIEGDLRLAQEYAAQGKKPGNCTNVNVLLNGYIFRVNADSTYDVIADCTGGNAVIVKNGSIPSGWTLTTGSVEFKSLGEGTSLPSGTSLTFTITPQDNNYLVDVVVNSSGNVTVNFR